MGRIGNALKRAVGLDNRKNNGFKPVKKTLKRLLWIPGILIMLVVVVALSLNMFAENMSEFIRNYYRDQQSTAAAAANFTPSFPNSSSLVDNSSGTVITGNPTSSGNSSGTATTVATSIEDIIVSGGDIPVTGEMREKLMLENVSIGDLVRGTLNPFGEAGDGDERFRDIVIKTQRKMRVRKHPSEAEITAYETQKRSEMWSAKMNAYYAAVSAAATPSPTPTTSASGTPAPSPSGSPTSAPTPPPAPTPNPGPSAPSSGRTEASIGNVVSPTVKEETLARPAYSGPGFSDGDGSSIRPTTRPNGRVTATPRVTASPRPTTSVSPTVSQGVSASPTSSVTASPTATGTPTPTATPIPTPTWTASDEAELQRAVSDWVDANSSEEDTTDYVDVTISGEQLRTYMNSYHTPWQVNYCVAGYIELYDVSISNNVGMSISQQSASMAFGYGNKIEYSLKVNYWAGPEWDNRQIDYDDRQTVLGDCYIDYSEDHSEEPVKIDDNTDMISCEGFTPIVLFNSIDGWAVHTSYSTRLDSLNAYGYYEQTVTGTDVSRAMESFFGHLDVEAEELSMFVDGLSCMPDQERISGGVSALQLLFRPGAYVASHIDISAFTHLDAGTQGGRAVIMALEIVNAGAVYDQDRRYEDGYYDCSSLVNRVYADLGIDLSWWDGHWDDTTTNGLAHTFVERGLVVSDHWDESVMQPGDVIMWSKPSRPDHFMCVYHAGIYVGDGMIVDASTRQKHVVYRQMWNEEEVTIIARPSAGM